MHQMPCLADLMSLWSRKGSIISSKKLLRGSALLLFLIAVILASGQELDDKAAGKNLSLNVYLLDTGQALVVGYVEDPRGLIFLRPTQYTDPAAAQYASRYRYENDTRQLYAWTDALTFKQGDTWRLMFPCPGFYGEYRVIFHLPGDLRLGRINSSEGLKYMVSASNDSLVVDAQAYSVRNPAITIEYQQPLAEDAFPEEIDGNVSSGLNNLLLIVGVISALVLVIGSAFAFMMRMRGKEMQTDERDMQKQKADHSLEVEFPDASKSIESARPLCEVSGSAASQFVDISKEEAELDEMPPTASQSGGMKAERMTEGKIEVGSELNAVLDTLTPRERSIMETLIKHGGRMTQMEMRYETGVPKSTLTMVLISLEKRNLVTRKEWGRTNVVELSERFFSGELEKNIPEHSEQ